MSIILGKKIGVKNLIGGGVKRRLRIGSIWSTT